LEGAIGVAVNEPYALSALDRFVEAAGESGHIDAKGPVKWDGGISSASLTKDIAAFANSRDGGVIVIGKAEGDANEFELVGVTDEQAASFDTTKVAQWINQRLSPPVSIVCHGHSYQGRRFVIITVEEFSEIPILCTKSFQDPDNPRNHVLRERTLYVRNSNAESAPLATIDELRQLIGLATAKRRDELLTMFDSVMKGRPLLAEPAGDDQFDQELQQIEELLGDDYSRHLKDGGWRLLIRPARYESRRWNNEDVLEQVIERRSIRLGDQFPPARKGTHPREWGIANEFYGELWTLAFSGQFLYVEEYRENHFAHEVSSHPPRPPIPSGKWLDWTMSIRQIFEMTLFASRLAEEYQPGEAFMFNIQATGIAGRKLASAPRISWEESEECKARTFEYSLTRPVEEFRAEWREIAAEAMTRFVRLFPHPYGLKVQETTMRDWVQKFEGRSVD
jgi:hypothetical protein